MLTRIELAARPIPKALRQLHASLGNLSGVMMRNAMALDGLKVPQTASVPEIARLVICYVETGKLAESAVRLLVLDCLESSNKRVFLFVTTPGALASWKSETPVTADRASAVINRTNPGGEVQYITDNGVDIRIVIAETHTSFSQDRTTLRLIPTRHAKVVVITANRLSGNVVLHMDMPGEETTHGGPIGFKNHYVARMAVILGVDLEPLNLSMALAKLEDLDLIEIIHSRAVTAEGKQTFTAGMVTDIRKFARFKEFKKDRIEHDEDEYRWLPKELDPMRNTTMPVRPLKTFISSRDGEVRFALHALSREVDYVIGHLHTHA